MEKSNVILFTLTALLLFACCLPAVGGFSDELVVPKWYAATFVSIVFSLLCSFHKTWCKGGAIRPTCFTVLAVCSVECLYAIADGWTDGSMSGIGIMGTFDNPAGLALWCCMCMPFAMVMAMDGKDSRLRVIGLFCASLFIVTVILSKSRAGVIALGLMAVMVCLFTKTSRRWTVMKIVTCLFVIASAVWYTVSRKVDSTNGRRFIIERTWELIAEKPLTGHGHGGFNREYMARQADFFRDNPNSVYAILADDVRHPLNEFAKAWVEYGVCGPIVLLTLMVVPFLILWRKGGVLHRTLAMCLVPVLVFSCFSYPFNYPVAWLAIVVANCMAFVLIAGRLLCVKGRKVCIVGIRTFLFVSLVMLANEYRYEHEWYSISRKAARGYSELMMPRYKKLYPHYRENPYFLYNYMAEQFFAGHFADALSTAGECRKLWSGYNLELLTGDICRRLGKNDEAIRHYKEAGYMCPSRFAPLEGLYYAYTAKGDTTSANAIVRDIAGKEMKVVSADALRIKSLENI